MPTVAVILSLMIITVLVVTVVCIKYCRVPCYKCCMKRGYLPPSVVIDSTEKYVNEKWFLRSCCSKQNEDSDTERPTDAAGGCPPLRQSRNIKNIFFCLKEAEVDRNAKAKFKQFQKKGHFSIDACE